MNQQPFFNAPQDTRNNPWCVSYTCPLDPSTRGGTATPPSAGNRSSFIPLGSGRGLWGSVAKGAAALPRLGSVRQGHVCQFVLVDSSLPLLFPSAFLAFPPDCWPRRSIASGGLMPRPKLRPCCCVPLQTGYGPGPDRLGVETEDATHAPSGHGNCRAHAVGLSGDRRAGLA